MSTIQQVASLAKVSVATVSRVINNSAGVSIKTRQKVDQAIERLKYQPNAMGTFLRRDKTNMILVLVHSVDNPFFSMIIQGIENIAHHNNYNVLICTTYGDRLREQHYVKMLRNHYVDGMILISNTLTLEEIDDLNTNYPLVQVIEYLPESKAPYYSVDFYKASYDLMEHMIQNGCRNIAYVHTGSTHIVSHCEKYRAYQDVLNKHKLPILSKTNEEYNFGFIAGKAVAALLLDHHPQIDGFFATSDLIAIGIIDEIHSRKKKVPKDIVVVGFDNTIFSTLSNPAITTVELNTYELGCKSMELLLNRIEKVDTDIKIDHILPFQVIVKESSLK
jgi:LacI family transcriptional regulator, repressor for deo operon, udp, cdd, tsx, nupC, and nupG